MASSLPYINNVRLAQPADIKRMASVTIAGFHTSQSFQYIQPHYQNHKIDALRSQRHSYRDSMMKEMDRVLLVIEDEYNPAEDETCPNVITTEEDETKPQAGDKVVVGVAMFVLPNDSERIGEYQNTKAMEIDLPERGNGKDSDFRHYLNWAGKEAAIKKEHFTKHLYLSALVVHPAYERRGHGANLIKWGMQFASKDCLDVGLIASEVANPLYKRLGFDFVGKFDIEGDELSPRGIHYEVLKLVKISNSNDSKDNNDEEEEDYEFLSSDTDEIL